MAILLLVGFLAASVGCGGSDGPVQQAPSPPTAGATGVPVAASNPAGDPSRTVLRFIELSRAGGYASHRLLSKRLISSLEGRGPVGAELAGWSDPSGRVDAVVKSVATQEGSPARAEVVIEYTWMNVPFEERYILTGEDDGWYIDQILLGDKVIVGREFVPGTVAPAGEEGAGTATQPNRRVHRSAS